MFTIVFNSSFQYTFVPFSGGKISSNVTVALGLWMIRWTRRFMTEPQLIHYCLLTLTFDCRHIAQ